MQGLATLLPHAGRQPVVTHLVEQMHHQMQDCISCVSHYHRNKVSLCTLHPTVCLGTLQPWHQAGTSDMRLSHVREQPVFSVLASCIGNHNAQPATSTMCTGLEL